MGQYFYDKQLRGYIQQFIRLFGGFNVQMGFNDDRLPVFQKVPVRYGDINRMAAHITRENSENIVNTVPLISCYVTDLNMAPERRIHQEHVDKVQVFEKKKNDVTGAYENDIGARYEVQRYMPVPYNLVMNCDIWTSNTDQKLQLLEQIMVLFNPTLNIRTNDNAVDWSSLSYVEMTNSIWSSRSIGSTIDDIIDVSTLTFTMPIWVNPPAKVKQQKLIHTLINELYSLDDANLDLFREDKPFNTETLQYTVVTFDQMKLEYSDGAASLLNKQGSVTDENGNPLEWKNYLSQFGELRPGISQIRLRKSNDPSDKDNDIIGKLSETSNPNIISVDIDTDTLPQNTVNAVDAVLDPTKNYPGDGVVPPASQGQRYLLTDNIPQGPVWPGLVANVNDIIEFNGSAWTVSFDSLSNSTQQYMLNNSTGDQLEWSGTEWFNSFEGIYKPGYWRLYL
jgi:hypothetical protein